MNTTFVVVINHRSLTEWSDHPVFVTPYLSIAEQFIEQYEKRQARCKKISYSIDMHLEQWKKQNPPPKASKSSVASLPFWHGPKESWTAAQKEKFNTTKKVIEETLINQNKPYRVWAEEAYAEKVRYTKTFTEQEQQDLEKIFIDVTLEVHSVPYSEI